jgi:MFS family permease
MTAADRKAAEAGLHDQTNFLPRRQLLVVFATLAVSLLVCVIDQNGVGVALPAIGRDLNAETTVSWAGTSALIANTVFQVLYGRLSDIFGKMTGLDTIIVGQSIMRPQLMVLPNCLYQDLNLSTAERLLRGLWPYFLAYFAFEVSTW